MNRIDAVLAGLLALTFGFVFLFLLAERIHRKITSWTSYHNEAIKGVLAAGDPTKAPTSWLNWAYYAWFGGWTKVTVFLVPTQTGIAGGYHIGFIAHNGKMMVKKRITHDIRFRVRNGHEDCTFFIIAKAPHNGSFVGELQLELVAQTTVDDPTYKNVPLH